MNAVAKEITIRAMSDNRGDSKWQTICVNSNTVSIITLWLHLQLFHITNYNNAPTIINKIL